MSWSPQQDKQSVAYEITLKNGQAVVAYALNGGAAKNRGAKLLGKQKCDVLSCVRRPDLDAGAPMESSLRQKRGKPLPAGVYEHEQANPQLRFCTKCNSFQAIENFSITAGHGRECKTCRAKRWASNTIDQRKKQLISMARHRSRVRGHDFNLLPEDIEIPAKCPVLGIPIKFSDVKNRHNSPSIDRIKPELGYVPGNVIVVSWLANDIRRNFSPDDIIAVGKFYKSLYEAG